MELKDDGIRKTEVVPGVWTGIRMPTFQPDQIKRHVMAMDGVHCKDCNLEVPVKQRRGPGSIVCSDKNLGWYPGNLAEAFQCTQVSRNGP